MSSKNPFDPGYYYTEDLKSFGFKKVGSNVAIAKDCVINGLENISLGDNIRIDSRTTVIALRGKLNIGSYVHIGGTGYVNSAGGIEIKNFVNISSRVSLFSINDDYSGKFLTGATLPAKFRVIEQNPIVIEPHVIIGCGAIILPGVKVGEGAAIGALSLVKKSVPAWEIYSGIPAKYIKDRSRELLNQEKLLLEIG